MEVFSAGGMGVAVMSQFTGGGMATRLCVAMFLASSRLMATQRRVAMPPSHAPSMPGG
jgi:hypothetical protein